MSVSVETTQGLERRVNIQVPAQEVVEQVEKRIKVESKKIRIDGFRPGKVPLSVVKKRYGAAIHQEVVAEVMQRKFIDVIIENKINPAGAPTFTPAKEEGENLTFDATFEVYPEVELADFATIEVEKPVCEIKDADVDNMVETLRKQHATFENVERAAEAGDKTVLDFAGSIDGEEFEGGKSENFDLELGAGRMIPGFEDGIIGKKAGESFDITVTFPEDYHAENLKGKDAVFAINLKEVKQSVLPELNEEFVQLFGVKDGSIEGLKAEITKNMQRELDQALKAKTKQQVLDGLVAANEIDAPKAVIEQEVNVLRQQAVQRFGGNADNMPELPAELFTEQAEKRAKVGLLLGEVIKTHNVEASDEAIEAMILSMASAYEDPSEVVEYYKGNEQLMQQMKNVAIEEQAVETILKTAKVTEKEVDFQEFMNQAS